MTLSKFFNASFYSQKLKSFFIVPKVYDYSIPSLYDENESSIDLLARMFNLSEDEMIDLSKDDIWIVTKNGEDLWTCPSDQDANLLVSVLERENPEHQWGVRTDEIIFGTNDDHIEDSSQLISKQAV